MQNILYIKYNYLGGNIMSKRLQLYKDLAKMRKTRNRERKKYYNKTSRKYKPRSWTKEEDEAVLAHEVTDFELSSIIHHSIGSIQARRCLLKKQQKEEN